MPLAQHAKREKMRTFHRCEDNVLGWRIQTRQLSEVIQKLRNQDDECCLDMETLEDTLLVLDELGYLVVEDA